MTHIVRLRTADQPSRNNLFEYRWNDPLLGKTEERELVALAQAGDNAARENLVEHFHGWLWSLLKPFWRMKDEDLEDVLAAALQGFNTGIDKFDPRKPWRLMTCAKSWVMDAVYVEVRRINYHSTAGEGDADKHVAAHPKLIQLYAVDPDEAVRRVAKAAKCKEDTAERALERPSLNFRKFVDEAGDGVVANPGSRKSLDADKQERGKPIALRAEGINRSGDVVQVDIDKPLATETKEPDQDVVVRKRCGGRIVFELVEQRAKNIDADDPDSDPVMDAKWKPPSKEDHATIDLGVKRAAHDEADALIASFIAGGGVIKQLPPSEPAKPSKRAYRKPAKRPRRSSSPEPKRITEDDKYRVTADGSLTTEERSREEVLAERAKVEGVEPVGVWRSIEDERLRRVRERIATQSRKTAVQNAQTQAQAIVRDSIQSAHAPKRISHHARPIVIARSDRPLQHLPDDALPMAA